MSPSKGTEESTAKRRGRYRVSVSESAKVVARGEQVERWFVKQGNGWVSVTEHPDATPAAEAGGTGGSDPERSPPGTVWERQYEVFTERGARLLLRQSFPRRLALGAMDYLERGMIRVPRALVETEYVVVGNYRLRRVPSIADRPR